MAVACSIRLIGLGAAYAGDRFQFFPFPFFKKQKKYKFLLPLLTFTLYYRVAVSVTVAMAPPPSLSYLYPLGSLSLSAASFFLASWLFDLPRPLTSFFLCCCCLGLSSTLCKSTVTSPIREEKHKSDNSLPRYYHIHYLLFLCLSHPYSHLTQSTTWEDPRKKLLQPLPPQPPPPAALTTQPPPTMAAPPLHSAVTTPAAGMLLDFFRPPEASLVGLSLLFFSVSLFLNLCVFDGASDAQAATLPPF